MDLCKEMIDAAAAAGVDAVKLQKRDNRALFTRAFYDGAYNSENSYGDTYGEHREALELSADEYVELRAHAESLGVVFFATAFDLPSADLLAELDMPAYKIASGDITNVPLLEHVARIGKPMIISTGGATMTDVERAHATVSKHLDADAICVLQCTAGYPPAWEELNLRVIETFRAAFPDNVIGLSSHDSGIAMAMASYLLGARVIEKHFTLNRAMKGTDQVFSLEPTGMRKLVRDLRRTRQALGDGIKRTYESERAPVRKMSKMLVAARPLSAGHVLVEGDIVAKSPGDGLPPYQLPELLGRALVRDVDPDEPLDLGMLAGR